MDFLEKLWLGTAEAPVIQIRRSAFFKDLARRHIKETEEMEALLSEELREKLHSVIATQDILSTYCEREAFKYGVKIGMQVIKEANDQGEAYQDEKTRVD